MDSPTLDGKSIYLLNCMKSIKKLCKLLHLMLTYLEIKIGIVHMHITIQY